VALDQLEVMTVRALVEDAGDGRAGGGGRERRRQGDDGERGSNEQPAGRRCVPTPIRAANECGRKSLAPTRAVPRNRRRPQDGCRARCVVQLAQMWAN
jgi:hypothetical protein